MKRVVARAARLEMYGLRSGKREREREGERDAGRPWKDFAAFLYA